MKNFENQFLVPCYLEKFSCVGALCEDTCCKSWTVHVDKKTYKSYKKLNSKDTKLSFQKHIFLNKQSVGNADYGFIKINDDGFCPYLSEDKWCRVHSELGEEFLSYICFSYPRVVNRVNGLWEMSGTASCPEIAKLVLLNELPLEFKDVTINSNRVFTPSVILEDTYAFDKNTDVEYYFWPLRIFTIDTLQDRRYTLMERLILLGLVYKKLIRLAEDRQLDKTLETLENYKSIFHNVDKMKDSLSARQENKGLQFSDIFVRQLVSLDGAHINSVPNYLQTLRNLNEGLMIENNKFSLIQENYNIAYDKYYYPYMKDREYILENYLVNEVFKELYPLARTESIYSSYKKLLTLHNVIKFHLVGVSAYYKKLDDSIVVDTIQSFSKAILHHKSNLNIFEIG